MSVRRKAIRRDVRYYVFQLYCWTCGKCGSKSKPTIDHIKPLSHGGTNDYRNLQCLCEECNVEKGDGTAYYPPRWPTIGERVCPFVIGILESAIQGRTWTDTSKT